MKTLISRYYIFEAAWAVSTAAKPGARGAVWVGDAAVLLSYLTDRGSNTGRPRLRNQVILSDGGRSDQLPWRPSAIMPVRRNPRPL
jgi:hypothetical protein